MSCYRLASICAATLGALAFAPAAARAGSAPARVAPYVAAIHAGARDLGPLQPEATIDLAVVLRYRDPAGLDALLVAQRDSRSPLYRRFLTRPEFDAAFAPTPAQERRVIDALQRDGFVVRGRYPNRTVLDVRASASAVARTFGTELRRLSVDGALHFANVRPAVTPANLRGDVLGTVGFDDLRSVHPMHAFALPATRVARPLPAASSPPLYGLDGGAGPVVTSRAYDLPVEHADRAGTPYDGRGNGAAIVVCGNFLERNLTRFLHYFGVARTGPPTVQVPVDGGGRFGLDNCSVEATLDAETIVGNAPGVALHFYSIPDLAFTSIVDAYDRVVSDDAVAVVNSSFGGCEATSGDFPQATDALAQQGAGLGITFSASTGDSGSGACYPGTNANVNAPASGPHFVAVGGTSLTVDAQGGYVSEAGWSGSGGGYSAVFNVPPYQRNFPNVYQIGRSLPDVAYPADPAIPGASLYIATGWYGPIGGTSWSSPLFCALVAELAQKEGRRIGDPHEALYGTVRHTGYADFHDITTGSNGYAAGPGYDNVTGIGSIVGYPFAQHL